MIDNFENDEIKKELSIVQKLQNIADEINNLCSSEFAEKIEKWQQEEHVDNNLIFKAVWRHRYDSPTLSYCLATSFKWRVFTEESSKSAFEWFQIAAENGHMQSLNDLGDCYERGDGTVQNLSKAFENYLKAAKSGSIYGQSNVGCAYYFGLGVDQDMEKAVCWLRKAANANVPDAQYYLGSLYFNGDGVECDERKAFYWLNLCGWYMCGYRIIMLGECYEQGRGTLVDVHAAIKCLYKTYQRVENSVIYDKFCDIFREEDLSPM
ncbi:13070_t:CDS:1 [Ambispora gerdemannii]|uniref:13070_t:CDS:1 n=1 Tax=Ambispora gerdemannii TaxID=144530 RepID=A0A9N9A4G0_9GLOM|nr:13070_t:CDS:1 [Ambispora gerdemannii]